MQAQQDNIHQKVFKAYAGEQKIVIADPGSVSRATLTQALISLGAKLPNITLTTNMADAEAAIALHKPRIVITDYDLGKKSGLDLLQRQRAQAPLNKDSLFILVTGNTSQTAVARAAEEDVDAFILKPFTMAVLKSSLLKAAIFKLKPPEYFKVIETGKILLLDNKLDEAMVEFEKAQKLHPQPSLALFYIGQIKMMKKALEEAEGSFNTGLNFNKIHYKCLVGLYDILMSKNRHAEAYEVIRKISHYFPANPTRMTQVLRLAILTKSYEDVERYYLMFTNLDDRNEDLIKYVCAALVVCGKHYLQKRMLMRAKELFVKAAASGSGRPRVLRDIITSFIDHGLTDQGAEFLKKFPADTQAGPDYLSMKLLIADQRESASSVIEEGRALLKRGIEDPIVYSILIKRSQQSSLQAAAADLAKAGTEKFPNFKDQFAADLATKPSGT